MGKLARRFLVLLMRRILAFCHGQQLTVPILFFFVFEGWQIAERHLTWESFKSNPWNEIFPYVVTVGVLLVVQIWLAVRDLNRELIEEAKRNIPTIIHEANVLREPSKLPARVMGLVMTCCVICGESFMVERAYPTDTLVINLPRPPLPPVTVKGPKLHLSQLFLVRYQVEPYEADKQFKVRVYLDNRGTVPIDVNGYSRSEVINDPPEEYKSRRKLERQLWKKLTSPKDAERVWMSIPAVAPGTYWMLMKGGTISDTDIKTLSTTAAVYFTGKIEDRAGSVVLELCFRTVPHQEALMLCARK